MARFLEGDVGTLVGMLAGLVVVLALMPLLHRFLFWLADRGGR